MTSLTSHNVTSTSFPNSKNTKAKELTGYQIIKLIKEDKRLKETLKTGKIDDFVKKY